MPATVVLRSTLLALIVLVLLGMGPHRVHEKKAPRSRDEVIRTVLVAGGALPSSNHVSFEQDLLLAQTVLPGPHRVLFGGGSHTKTVQELAPEPVGDPLRAQLAEILDPRPGRRSRYRAPRIDAEPATAARVAQRLGEALSTGDGPLYLYLAAHGEQGETPAESWVSLWGDSSLTVAELAALHDSSPGRRELVAVVASCFSGSFAELAFTGADPGQGPAHTRRCGFFASTWDASSTGCDSNPNRDQQESYAIHLLQALAGGDRDGRVLPAGQVDLDRDGRVSLLEAHTRARIALVSIDVPTTTSERYLRHAVPEQATVERAVSLPEEDVVIAKLGQALGLDGEEAVLDRLTELDDGLQHLDADLAALESELEERSFALVVSLLERWPELDDPWHPSFEEVLEQNRKVIALALRASPEGKAYARAELAVRQRTDEWAALEVGYARVLRLWRAHETRQLARRLRAIGGSQWRHYSDLLECERQVP